MAKATSKAGYGKGWHKQSSRHSNARKTGTAGGKYAISKRIDTLLKDNPKLKNMNFKELKNKGIFLKYQSDTDKDGVVNINDCQPLNKKEHSIKERIKTAEEKTVQLFKKGLVKAEELTKEGIEKAKQITIQTKKKIKEIQEEKKIKQQEALAKAIEQSSKRKLIPEIKEHEITKHVKEAFEKEEAIRIKEEEPKEFFPVEQIFEDPEYKYTPEKAQELAERTTEAIRESKRKRIDDLSNIELSELNDNELKEISIKLGTGYFATGNKYENELKRRIREKSKIETNLRIETMKAEKIAKERIQKEIQIGAKAGGYVWDDWFK